MTHLLRSIARLAAVGVCGGALSLGTATPANAEGESDGVERTQCEGDFVCPFPNAVCCPDLKMCCPARQRCPVQADEECIYTEPEDDVEG